MQTEMLLLAISTDLGYLIFTNSNEKFINLFVRVFAKSDGTRPPFYKSIYRLKNCHATVSLIFALFALALQIVSV